MQQIGGFITSHYEAKRGARLASLLTGSLGDRALPSPWLKLCLTGVQLLQAAGGIELFHRAPFLGSPRN